MYYRLYLINENYEKSICNFKCIGNSMEECYNEYGKQLVENGLRAGHSIQSQIKSFKLFMWAIHKRKDDCYKIRATDYLMYLSCYCALYKFNEMNDNHFFLKIK